MKINGGPGGETSGNHITENSNTFAKRPQSKKTTRGGGYSKTEVLPKKKPDQRGRKENLKKGLGQKGGSWERRTNVEKKTDVSSKSGRRENKGWN